MIYKKQCELCNKQFESLYESQLEYNFNAHKISCNKRGLYKTNIELIMKKALEDNKIQTVYNFPIRCKYGYQIDFALPELKIGIECDGEVWHKEGNSHDRKRNAYLNSQGWIIIRFKGKQIEEDISSCINKIKIKINERRDLNGKN